MNPSVFNALNLIKVFGASLVVAAHYAGNYFGQSFYAFGTGCFFLVAGYYAFTWERDRGIHYLAKRFVRLYPGYMLAVVAYLVFRDVASWPTVLFHHSTFLLSTPDFATVFSLNPAFWSLPVFFTFFALFAFLPRMKPTWIGVLWLMALPFVALSLGIKNWHQGYAELLAFPMHLYAFWLGGLLGLRAHAGEIRTHHAYTAVAFLLMIAVVLIGSHHKEFIAEVLQGQGYLYRTLMVAIYGGLLWAIMHSPLVERRSAIIAFFGTISFGVFLFHNLPIGLIRPHLSGWVAAGLSVAVAVALAWVSWTFVESPIYRWARPWLAHWKAASEREPLRRRLRNLLDRLVLAARRRPGFVRFLLVLGGAFLVRIWLVQSLTDQALGCRFCLIPDVFVADLPWLAALTILFMLSYLFRNAIWSHPWRWLAMLGAGVYVADVVSLLLIPERLVVTPLWANLAAPSSWFGVAAAWQWWHWVFVGTAVVLLSRAFTRDTVMGAARSVAVAGSVLLVVGGLSAAAGPVAGTASDVQGWLTRSVFMDLAAGSSGVEANAGARQAFWGQVAAARRPPWASFRLPGSDWPEALLIRSAGFGSGPSFTAFGDQSHAPVPGRQLKLERGVTLLGINRRSLPENLAHVDLCRPEGEGIKDFGAAMAAGTHDAFAIVVDDTAFCRDVMDLQPVMAGTGLSDWARLRFRQPYIAVVTREGQMMELLGEETVVNLVVEAGN
jgi:peptidoglycan/LPS O-acetylase OafA/YrhL